MGIHSSGFNDFLLKPELSQVMVMCASCTSACMRCLCSLSKAIAACRLWVRSSSDVSAAVSAAQAIKDCGFEHPSEGESCSGTSYPTAAHPANGTVLVKAELARQQCCVTCTTTACVSMGKRHHPATPDSACPALQSNTSASPRPSWAWMCCARPSPAWARQQCSCSACCSRLSPPHPPRSRPSCCATPASWPTRCVAARPMHLMIAKMLSSWVSVAATLELAELEK